jgi:hypothetical protein
MNEGFRAPEARHTSSPRRESWEQIEPTDVSPRRGRHNFNVAWIRREVYVTLYEGLLIHLALEPTVCAVGYWYAVTP